MAIVRTKNRPSFVESHTGDQLATVEQVYDFADKQGLSVRPLDVKSLLKLFNIALLEEEMDGISGYIEKRNGVWFISINQYDHSRRKLFTMAHELGHFLLHKNLIEKEGKHTDVILLRDGASNIIEKEANTFASELLMPEKDIRTFIHDSHLRTIESLAEKFGVSTAAMHYRLLRLGFLR